MYYIGTMLEGCIDLAPAGQAAAARLAHSVWVRLGGFAQAELRHSITADQGYQIGAFTPRCLLGVYPSRSVCLG
jgi:hypothetical protein